MSDQHNPEAQRSSASRRQLLTLGSVAAVGVPALAIATATPAAATVSGATYTSVTPERLIDTRKAGGRISANETRTSTSLAGAQYTCVCNLTVIKTSGKGYLALYSAALTSRPNPYWNLTWQGDGKTISNLVMFDTGSGGFKIYCSGGSTHYIVDFIGYFTTASAAKTAEQEAFEERARAAARALGPD